MKNRRKNSKKKTNDWGRLFLRILKNRAFHISLLFIMSSVLAYFLSLYVYGVVKRELSLRNFVVTGNTHLSDREVISLMKVKRGHSLLDIRSEDLKKQILRSPWIKRVLIRKELPHTLIVRVKEASPVAILKRGKSLYLVDREGILLERISQSPSFLPVIELKGADKRLYRQALFLARVVNSMDYFNDREIIITGKRPEDLSLMVDGLLIKVGAGEYTEKLSHLIALSDRIENIKIPVEYVDLRFKKKLIIRPAKR